MIHRLAELLIGLHTGNGVELASAIEAEIAERLQPLETALERAMDRITALESVSHGKGKSRETPA